MQSSQRLVEVTPPQDLADKVRGRFIERVKEECGKAESAAREKNPYASREDVFQDAWVWDLRSQTQKEAQQHGVGLAEVALAGWHLKYVDQNVSSRTTDPDPSFPWTLFRKELLMLKEHDCPCCIRELRHNHHLCRILQRGAAKENQQKVAEAIKGLKVRMKCPECHQARERLLESLHEEGSISDIAKSVKAISGRGSVMEVDCKDLRYCKDYISDAFDNGPQSGMRLQELAERLAKGEQSASELVLTVVSFHGLWYVIEGNKRLWCLKEAQTLTQKRLMASVRIPDLYFGFVQRQDHKEPALPYFLQRFSTRCNGQHIQLQTSDLPHGPSVSKHHVPGPSQQAGDLTRPGRQDLHQQGQKRVMMGKMTGKSYAQAYEDVGFRKWVLNNINDRSQPEMKDLKNYFLAQTDGVSLRGSQAGQSISQRHVPGTSQQSACQDLHQQGQWRVTVGKKMRDKSYAEAYEDVGYRKWVLDNINERSNSEMKDLKKYFLARTEA